MSNSKSSKKQTPIKTIILISAIVVFSLWALNFFLLKLGSDERGVFGDMFGAVNSLFSGLAFAGIIITIYLQRNELTLQRKELELTREEFKTQNTTLRLQRFENTFFSMLSLHHQIVNGIDHDKREFIPNDPEMPPEFQDGETITLKLTGRDVFHEHFKKLRIAMMGESDNREFINSHYMSRYWIYQNNFDHYFMNLYSIIKLVDTTQLTNNLDSKEEFLNKYKYTSLVRAQISTYELLWLFYNCLSDNGFEKFKPLIEKYSLFKNLRFKELAEDRHRVLYENLAYEHE